VLEEAGYLDSDETGDITGHDGLPCKVGGGGGGGGYRKDRGGDNRVMVVVVAAEVVVVVVKRIPYIVSEAFLVGFLLSRVLSKVSASGEVSSSM